MRDQIKLWKKSSVEMTFTEETQAEKRSSNPQHQIKIATEFLAETNDHCPFSTACIRFAVTIIIDYQQGIDKQSAD